MHSRSRTVLPSAPSGISVPIQNPFNPFTVADATLIHNGVPVPVTTGVGFRAINDEPAQNEQDYFSRHLVRRRDFAVSWANLAITSRVGIGNWVFVIRGTSRKISLGGVVSKSGLA